MIKMKIKLTASLLGLAICVGQAEETETRDKAEVKIVIESKDLDGETETVSEVVELGKPKGAKVEVRRIEVKEPAEGEGRKKSAKRTTRVYRLAKPKAQVVEEATCSSPKTTYLGIHTTPVESGLAKHLGLPDGFYQSVRHVAPDSPAAAAGLKEHDILQKVNDQMIINFEQLHVLIRSKKAGEKVKLTVLRQGSEKHLAAKLGSRDVATAQPVGAHGSAIYGYIPTPDGKKLELSFHPDHPHDIPKEVREHIEEELKNAEEKIKHAEEELKKHHGSKIKKHHQHFVIPHGKGDKNYLPKLPADLPDDVRKLIEEQMKKSKNGGIDFHWHEGKKGHVPHKHEGKLKEGKGKKHSSSNSTVTRTVKASGKGELHYEKNNGLETLKAVGPDGALLYDGPINTPEEKAKVPAEMLKWLEESLKNKPHRPDFRHRDPFAPGSFKPRQIQPTRPGKTTDA